MNLAENTNRKPQPSAWPFDFDRIADRYDKWYQSLRGKVYDRVEKKAVSNLLAGVPKSGRLLDVGCGTGHWSRYFSDKGFEVTGIDRSEKMIQIARKKHIPNSRFEVAEGEHLPFEDRSFDAAVAFTVLEFASDPKRIISEMVRCVKNNKGVIIIGVLNALNPYNQKRKNQPGSVYSFANLFLPQHLRSLLSPYGVPKMRITAFVSEKDWLLAISPLWEYIGRFFSPQKGAFIVSKVVLWTCRRK